MPRMQVGFIDRPVAPLRNRFGVGLHCPPKVRDHAIEVVYRLDSVWMRSGKQHSPRSKEGLDVVCHVTEAIPDDISDAGLSTKPREWGFKHFVLTLFQGAPSLLLPLASQLAPPQKRSVMPGDRCRSVHPTRISSSVLVPRVEPLQLMLRDT